MTIPVAPIIGIVASKPFRDSFAAISSGQWANLPYIAGHFVGIQDDGKFSFTMLKDSMTPVVAGILAHKVASIAGINKILGKAKVPYLRI